MTKQEFKDALKQMKFKKYHNYYYRLLNSNVFQVLGIEKSGSFYFVSFYSYILNVEQLTEEHFNSRMSVNDGFWGYELTELVDLHYEVRTKEDAIAVVTADMLKKLDDLNTIEKHINYMEDEKFAFMLSVKKPGFDWYLAIGDNENAKKILEQEILEQRILISKELINEYSNDYIYEWPYVDKCKWDPEYGYNKCLEYLEVLKKIDYKYNYGSVFKKIYTSNLEVINKVFGDNFNFVWPRLVPGINRFTIEGNVKGSEDGTMQFTYRYPMKIGDCAMDTDVRGGSVYCGS